MSPHYSADLWCITGHAAGNLSACGTLTEIPGPQASGNWLRQTTENPSIKDLINGG